MSMDKGDSGGDSSGGGFRDLMEQSGTPQNQNSTSQGGGQDSGPPSWGGVGGQQGGWSSSAPSDPMPPAHGAPSAGDSTQSTSPTGL
jgi:hypothetical protein